MILARDKKCVRCGAVEPDVVLHVDHIIPRARGGSDAINNLRALCARCNLAKSAKLPHDHEVPMSARGRRRGNLVGCYVVKLTPSTEGPAHIEFHGKIEKVAHGHAFVRPFECAMGFPEEHVVPKALAELLCGDWRWYLSYEDFRVFVEWHDKELSGWFHRERAA